MNIDWNKWGAPTVVIMFLGFVATWIRPALVSCTHWLFRNDPGKSAETLMLIWESKDGRLKMRAYMQDLFKTEVEDAAQTKAIAIANRDSLAQVVETQKLQGVQMRDIKDGVDKVPLLTDALQRMSVSMETFAGKMSDVSDFMSRSEERERIREQYERGEREERRLRQTAEPHPHLRAGEQR